MSAPNQGNVNPNGHPLSGRPPQSSYSQVPSGNNNTNSFSRQGVGLGQGISMTQQQYQQILAAQVNLANFQNFYPHSANTNPPSQHLAQPPTQTNTAIPHISGVDLTSYTEEDIQQWAVSSIQTKRLLVMTNPKFAKLNHDILRSRQTQSSSAQPRPNLMPHNPYQQYKATNVVSNPSSQFLQQRPLQQQRNVNQHLVHSVGLVQPGLNSIRSGIPQLGFSTGGLTSQPLSNMAGSPITHQSSTNTQYPPNSSLPVLSSNQIPNMRPGVNISSSIAPISPHIEPPNAPQPIKGPELIDLTSDPDIEIETKMEREPDHQIRPLSNAPQVSEMPVLANVYPIERSIFPAGGHSQVGVSSTPASYNGMAREGTSADKRKLIDEDGNEHLYPPAKKLQEAVNVPATDVSPQFNPSSRQHFTVLVRLASLYAQKLNEMGKGPLLLREGVMVPDPVWAAQHRQLVASLIYCLEATVLFVEKLRSSPHAFEIVSFDKSLSDKIEIQARIKLSELLMDHSNSLNRAEYHLNQALAVSQKNFGPRECSYGVRIQLAKLYSHIGKHHAAEKLLSDSIAEAASIELHDWEYAMTFELASLPNYSKSGEVLTKLYETASAPENQVFKAVVSLKLVLHHLRQRNLITLAGLLSQLRGWFDSTSNTDVTALKPYMYILSFLHMTLSGKPSPDIISEFDSTLDDWIKVEEEPEFSFKLALTPRTAQPHEVRLCWMSRRQAVILASFACGLSNKGSINANLCDIFLNNTIVNTRERFHDTHDGSFILGRTRHRQSFYIRLRILCHLHLAEFHTTREDFSKAHQNIHFALEICSRNGLWKHLGSYILHVRGMLAQAQSQFGSSFSFYKAALKASADPGLSLAISINALSLAIPNSSSPHPKLASLFESIKATCPAPRLPHLDATLQMFAMLFSDSEVTKKGLASSALGLSKTSHHSQLFCLLSVLPCLFYAFTQPDVAEKMLSKSLILYQKTKADIGAIATASALSKILEVKGNQYLSDVTKKTLTQCIESYKKKCAIEQ